MTLFAWAVVFLCLTIWVARDARYRGIRDRAGWIAGVLLLPIVFFPLYFAKRPLKAGEVRKGGVGWNFCKSLAIFWAAWAPLGLLTGSIDAALAAPTAEEAALGVVATVAVGFLLLVLVAGGTLLIGLLFRRPSVVEWGPTVGPSRAPGFGLTGSATGRHAFATAGATAQRTHAESPEAPAPGSGPTETGTQTPMTGTTNGSEPNVYEQVRRLAGLRDEGLLTPEEFEAKKREPLKLL